MADAQPIYVHVPCPGNEEDIADVAVRHAVALNVFKRQCPVGACVEEVIPMRGKGRMKCAWKVRYKRDMDKEFVHINGEELARSIMNFSPNNTEIVEKFRCSYPPFIELIYSIRCACKVSRRASRSFKRCDSVVNVKVEENLANLKLEEDLQE